MKKAVKFDLRDRVVEGITGLEGTIDAISFPLSGQVQYSVQPYCKEPNTRPEAYYIDESSLNLQRGEAKEDEIKFVEIIYEPGLRAKDMVTGFKGTIQRVDINLNGCVHYRLRGKYSYKLGKPNEVWVNIDHLKILENKKSKKKKGNDKLGGPVEKANQY